MPCPVPGSTGILIANVVRSPPPIRQRFFQTLEEETLAVVNAAITGNVSDSIQSRHIAGRAVSKYSLTELTMLRGYLDSVVWRQEHPGLSWQTLRPSVVSA